MNEKQIRKAIAEAKELSGIFFLSFKNDIEIRNLSQLSPDKYQSFIIEQHKKVSGTLIEFPSYLRKQETEIVKLLAVDLDSKPVQNLSTQRPDIDPMFKALYAVYDKITIRDYKFQTLITSHRPDYFQKQFYEWKYIYEKFEDVYYNVPPYGMSIFESGFYDIIHIITLSHFYLLKEKLSFYEAIIAEYIRLGDGVSCKLEREEDVKKLHKGLVDEEFIDKKTKEEHFIAAFTPKPLPYGFQKIKWMLLNREGNPHKTALREFLTMYCVKAPTQKDINRIITDVNNNEIQLPKPKPSEPSNYYITLTELVR